MGSYTPGTVTVDRVGASTWTVALHGEHDLTSTDQLRVELDAIFAQGTSVVVDFSDATFIDTAVVRELMYANQRVDHDPNEYLVIVAPRGGFPRRVLDLLDIDRLVQIFPSRDAALRLFAQGPA
jgi:anti-anti-sigma regulatory factor